MSLIIKLAICFQYGTIFNYVAELFPTHLRGLALGCSVAFGRTMSSLAAFMIYFTDLWEIHPLSTALITSMIAIPFSIILEETSHKQISN